MDNAVKVFVGYSVVNFENVKNHFLRSSEILNSLDTYISCMSNIYVLRRIRIKMHFYYKNQNNSLIRQLYI